MKFLALLLLCLTGCAIARPLIPMQVYHVEGPITFVIMDEREIAELSKFMFGRSVKAWCQQDNNTIYVPFDPLTLRPVFKDLGHETFHLNTFGGKWHK